MKKLSIFILVLVILVQIQIESVCAYPVLSFEAEYVPWRAIRDMAYCNGVYVMVGNAGLIMVSTDIENWTEVSGISYDDYIDYIVSNGTMFAAYGNSFILNSYDGYNWNKIVIADYKEYFNDDIIDPRTNKPVAYDGLSFQIHVTNVGNFLLRLGSDLGLNICYSTEDFINYVPVEFREEDIKRVNSYGKPPEFKGKEYTIIQDSGGTKISSSYELLRSDYNAYHSVKQVGDYLVGIDGRGFDYTTGDGTYHTVDPVNRDYKRWDEEIRWDNEIQWTGRDFLKMHFDEQSNNILVYRSDDKENWTEINLNIDTSDYWGPSRTAFKIKWWGDRYILERERNGKNAYIFDKDYNLIACMKTDEYVVEAAYFNSRYYYMNEYYKVYSSTDLENWEPDNEEGIMPIYNANSETLGLNNTMFKTAGNGFRNLTHSEYFRLMGDGRKIEIAYETPTKKWSDIFGEEFYYRVESNKLRVSKDGIYWSTLVLPGVISTTVKNVHKTEESFAFETSFWRFKIPLEEIRRSLNIENPVYIQLDDKILGFDTPPVVEHDRTLVPIRFLFESMGAEVDWNDELRQVAITKDDMVVRFSLDKKVAAVNGKAVAMDVPAKIIENKTMVPLRFISEKLGYEVEWDEATRTALIASK